MAYNANVASDHVIADFFLSNFEIILIINIGVIIITRMIAMLENFGKY